MDQEIINRLQHREKLLSTVNKAALLLLAIENEEDTMSALAQTLEMIGRCLQVDRVHLSRYELDENEVSFILISKWHSKIGRKYLMPDLTKTLSFNVINEFSRQIADRIAFNGPVTGLPPELQQFLNPYGTLKSIIILPLYMNGEPWGVITIDDCEYERTLPDEEMDIIRTAGLMFISVFNRFVHKELAITDVLTGVRNRRFFIEKAERELQTCIDESRDFSLIMTDIDHFKYINDRYGHTVGDEVLKIFCMRIQHMLKKGTLFARYGGEEFVITLMDANYSIAMKTARRLNKTIGEALFRVDNLVIKVTASFGVASKNEHSMSLPELTRNADKALYQAKGTGRNNVIGYIV